MFMWRRAIAGLLSGVLISFSFLPAVHASTVGTKCERPGEIRSAEKLICTKLGRDVTWKTFEPRFGPTGLFIYRYVNGKQQRKDVEDTWQSGDPRSSKTFDPIRMAAFKSINSLPKDPNITNFKLDFLVRPGYPKAIENAVRLQLNNVLSRFSRLLDQPTTAKIILITEKDRLWVRNDLPKIVPPNEYGGYIFALDSYGTKEGFYSYAGTGGGIAGYPPADGFAFYISHTSSLATLETYWPEVVPHESAHMLQGILSGGFEGQFPEGHPEAKWHGHLIEGSANTLGMALGFENVGWYSDEMDRIFKSDIQTYKNVTNLNSVSDTVAFIKRIEMRSTEESNAFSYSAGQIVWEYFIGKYGIEKFLKLLRNVNQTQNFNQNLIKTIGKDREGFYREAAGYLLRTWKRLST